MRAVVARLNTNISPGLGENVPHRRLRFTRHRNLSRRAYSSGSFHDKTMFTCSVSIILTDRFQQLSVGDRLKSVNIGDRFCGLLIGDRLPGVECGDRLLTIDFVDRLPITRNLNSFPTFSRCSGFFLLCAICCSCRLSGLELSGCVCRFASGARGNISFFPRRFDYLSGRSQFGPRPNCRAGRKCSAGGLWTR
jgi:hypothetical protein